VKLKTLAWSLAVPLGLLVAAFLLIPALDALPEDSARLRHLAPYFALGLSMGLSLLFNQSRLFFVLLGTLLLFALLARDLPLPVTLRLAPGAVLAHLAGFVYPLFLLVFLFLQDRGLFTLVGLSRWLLVIALPLTVIALGQQHYPVPLDWLEGGFLPPAMIRLTLFPDLVIVVGAVTLVILLARLVLRPGVVEGSLLTLLLAMAFALYYYPSLLRMEVFLAAAGLAVISAMIRNSFQLAYRDELTGLPARRALREQLLKLGRVYTIAMLDVDHFKRFNDRHGHDVGDQVLKMVASHIGRAGGGSRGYRYGGEEFTLVFPGKVTDEALEWLERLRGEIADARFTIRAKGRPRQAPQPASGSTRRRTPANRKQVRVTISIGVADSYDSETPEGVIKAADKALYRAKKKGRNRVST